MVEKLDRDDLAPSTIIDSDHESIGMIASR